MINYKIGDCLELMKELEANSFDIVFTSPPFKEEDVSGDYWEFYEGFFREAYRVAGKALIIIQSATKMNDIITRYPPKRTLIWGKGVIAASWRYNPIFVYQKSEDYKVNKYIWCDCLGVNPIKGKDKSHKYQDPLLLYETVLKMFKGCNSVLDPFAGSGTTLLAGKRVGYCKIMGFEMDKKYEELIRDRTLMNTKELSDFF